MDSKSNVYVTVMCVECEGKGKYTILNAYDKDYKREIVCEYCHGIGRTHKKIGVVKTSGLN